MHDLRLQTLTRTARHLSRRFVGALSPAGPTPQDEAWVETILGRTPSLALWRQMSGPDRRHAVDVARRVDAAIDATPPVLAAALLHDVGKISAGFGTFARVPATVVGLAGGRARAAGWAGASGLRKRLGLYLTHSEVGADMLREAGADPVTVAWAAEHHRPPRTWRVPPNVGAALKAADDD